MRLQITEYQEGVMRTSSTTNTQDLKAWLQDRLAEGISDPAAILMAGFGMGGEAGEVIDNLKKSVFHKHPFDRDKLIKEVGDILWYCTRMAVALQVPLEEIMQTNLDKLNKRYADGFSSEASINRAA